MLSTPAPAGGTVRSHEVYLSPLSGDSTQSTPHPAFIHGSVCRVSLADAPGGQLLEEPSDDCPALRRKTVESQDDLLAPQRQLDSSLNLGPTAVQDQQHAPGNAAKESTEARPATLEQLLQAVASARALLEQSGTLLGTPHQASTTPGNTRASGQAVAPAARPGIGRRLQQGAFPEPPATAPRLRPQPPSQPPAAGRYSKFPRRPGHITAEAVASRAASGRGQGQGGSTTSGSSYNHDGSRPSGSVGRARPGSAPPTRTRASAEQHVLRMQASRSNRASPARQPSVERYMSPSRPPVILRRDKSPFTPAHQRTQNMSPDPRLRRTGAIPATTPGASPYPIATDPHMAERVAAYDLLLRQNPLSPGPRSRTPPADRSILNRNITPQRSSPRAPSPPPPRFVAGGKPQFESDPPPLSAHVAPVVAGFTPSPGTRRLAERLPDFESRQAALIEKKRETQAQAGKPSSPQVSPRPRLTSAAANMKRTIEDLETWERRKQEHLAKVADMLAARAAEKEAQVATFKPQISERSRRIAEQMNIIRPPSARPWTATTPSPPHTISHTRSRSPLQPARAASGYSTPPQPRSRSPLTRDPSPPMSAGLNATSVAASCPHLGPSPLLGYSSVQQPTRNVSPMSNTQHHTVSQYASLATNTQTGTLPDMEASFRALAGPKDVSVWDQEPAMGSRQMSKHRQGYGRVQGCEPHSGTLGYADRYIQSKQQSPIPWLPSSQVIVSPRAAGGYRVGAYAAEPLPGPASYSQHSMSWAGSRVSEVTGSHSTAGEGPDPATGTTSLRASQAGQSSSARTTGSYRSPRTSFSPMPSLQLPKLPPTTADMLSQGTTQDTYPEDPHTQDLGSHGGSVGQGSEAGDNEGPTIQSYAAAWARSARAAELSAMSAVEAATAALAAMPDCPPRLLSPRSSYCALIKPLVGDAFLPSPRTPTPASQAASSGAGSSGIAEGCAAAATPACGRSQPATPATQPKRRESQRSSLVSLIQQAIRSPDPSECGKPTDTNTVPEAPQQQGVAAVAERTAQVHPQATDSTFTDAMGESQPLVVTERVSSDTGSEWVGLRHRGVGGGAGGGENMPRHSSVSLGDMGAAGEALAACADIAGFAALGGQSNDTVAETDAHSKAHKRTTSDKHPATPATTTTNPYSAPPVCMISPAVARRTIEATVTQQPQQYPPAHFSTHDNPAYEGNVTGHAAGFMSQFTSSVSGVSTVGTSTVSVEGGEVKTLLSEIESLRALVLTDGVSGTHVSQAWLSLQQRMAQVLTVPAASTQPAAQAAAGCVEGPTKWL